MKNVGVEVKKIIEEKGLMKKKVAEELGISYSYLLKVFKNETVDAVFLEKISAVIGVSPAYFFDDYETGNGNIVGNVSTTAFLGNATTTISQAEVELLKKVIDDKERIIAEKERLIKVLLEKSNIG